MKHQKAAAQMESKQLSLKLDNINESARVLKALGSADRLRIIQLLGSGSMNVQEVAGAAGLPVSTAAAHIRMLEDAGILMSEPVAGKHGAMKLCSRRLDHVGIRLFDNIRSAEGVLSMSMPLGGYSLAEDIQPTCGLVSDACAIGEYDNPRSFYMPGRFDAQLLWFRQGFVEYRFGLQSAQSIRVTSLELSFEACSEAPMFRNPWKSDISLFIAGKEIGVWTSPADLGGRKGQLTPAWWPDMMTQFGYLVTWRVDERGSYIGNARVSDCTISHLELEEHDCIPVRIGVGADARHVGGLNLFGERFGDYPQALVLRVGYEML